MRNRIVAVLALLLLPSAASAQGGRRGGGRMGGRGPGPMNPAQVLLDHRADLGLSDEQVTKLEDLSKQVTASHETMRASMDSIRGSSSMRDLTDAQREQMRALREAMMADNRKVHDTINSLLTADQLDKAAKILPPPGRGRGRGGAMRGGRGFTLGAAAVRTGPRTVAAFRTRSWLRGVRSGVVVRPRVLRPAWRRLMIRRAIRLST